MPPSLLLAASVGTPLLWTCFLGVVAVFLALDLGVFHRRAHAVGLREAAVWSVVWVALAGAFNLLVWQHRGSERGLEFLAGYLIEKALSIDNVFVFVVIPAIFAVTDDPFIVFTSNIFAILGLRSLYFLLAGLVDRFRYLKIGLALVLVFVGAKMLVAGVWKVPIGASLAVVAGLLLGSVLLSCWRPAPVRGA